MIIAKPVDLQLLQTELAAASIIVPALGTYVNEQGQTYLHTYDDGGAHLDLPPEALPIVDAHVAPPLVTEFAGTQEINAVIRTTNASPVEVFRFPCAVKHIYEASLKISGMDAVSSASLMMEGRFAWKRPSTGNAVMIGSGGGITVVSNLRDAAAASWAPNCLPQGTDVVFTVQGASGRTIDWLLTGNVGVFAPDGLN